LHIPPCEHIYFETLHVESTGSLLIFFITEIVEVRHREM